MSLTSTTAVDLLVSCASHIYNGCPSHVRRCVTISLLIAGLYRGQGLSPQPHQHRPVLKADGHTAALHTVNGPRALAHAQCYQSELVSLYVSMIRPCRRGLKPFGLQIRLAYSDTETRSHKMAAVVSTTPDVGAPQKCTESYGDQLLQTIFIG